MHKGKEIPGKTAAVVVMGKICAHLSQLYSDSKPEEIPKGLMIKEFWSWTDCRPMGTCMVKRVHTHGICIYMLMILS